MTRGPTLPDHVKDEARRLRARRLSIEAIAESLDVSKSAVHRAVAGMPFDGRPAANRKRADAAPAWWPEARQLAKTGLSRLAIADALGVPKSSVYRAFARFSPPG